MPAEAFRPTLFFNEQCPFCMKVRIFLLESGLRDSVDIKEFSPGSAEETAITQMLGTHLEKVSVPAAELSAGEYVADSGAIIARLAATRNIDPDTLPVVQGYSKFVLDKLAQLYRENIELKKQLA